MMEYRKRVVDSLLQDKLDAMGAVLIEGPKACGKTTTAEQVAGSVLYMNDPSKAEEYRRVAQTDIGQLLVGKTPRMIDEWQDVPEFWDAIRFEVDHRENDGQFILTGSAVPPGMDRIKHSGAGRFAFLKMRPMTLWESGESTGDVSLELMFDSLESVGGHSELSIEDVAFAICRGGWPGAVKKKSAKAALIPVSEYLETIASRDMSRIDGVSRDYERSRKLFRSYARHIGTQASIGTIMADMSANEADSISDETVISYLNALRKIFVVEDMKAWNPNLRSRTAVRTSDTRYFVDPSIATAALGLGPKDLLNDLNTFGFFFESLCIRDLRVYADVLGGDVYHFRDKGGNECDAVVHLRNGRYGLIEIKLGGRDLIEEGAKSLKNLAKKIDTTRMFPPSFQMILVGVGEYAYRREDGVFVIPVGCLRP